MVQSLKTLFQEICSKIEYNYVEPTNEHQLFLVRLKNLDFIERAILADKVYQLDWNIGSSDVYCSLQCAGISDISVLLFRQTNLDSVENILNDLVDHSPILLASLINTYCCPSKEPPILKLRTHIDEYFSSLVTELTSEDPNAVLSNYLASMKPHLSAVNLQQIKSVHVKLFLETSKFSATEAISKQKSWVTALKANQSTVLYELMRECISNDDQNAALAQLLELVCKDTNFDGWQCFLTFITVASTRDDIDIFKMFKSFQKETFVNCISRKSQHLFHVLMLTARQLSYSAADKFNCYQKWYKDTIGEMIYSNAKVTADSFEFIMNLLTEMIQFEIDPDLVNIHINTAIAAPPKCNELVLTFKQQSRSHLVTPTRKPISENMLKKTILLFEDDDDDDDDDVMIVDN